MKLLNTVGMVVVWGKCLFNPKPDEEFPPGKFVDKKTPAGVDVFDSVKYSLVCREKRKGVGGSSPPGADSCKPPRRWAVFSYLVFCAREFVLENRLLGVLSMV